MMMTALRYVGAVVAGVVVAFVLIIAVEAFSATVHPMPEDFDGSHEEMCEYVERCPAWVLAVVVPLWGLTAFAGSWTAGKLGNCWFALLIGLLLLAAVIMNILMLPYPLWFEIASPIVIALGSVIAFFVSASGSATAA